RAIEMPEALLKAMRVTVGGRDTGGESHESLVARVRERVPEEHRATFDELLGEARATYRLRDERGGYSDISASGLMRRAAPEAGGGRCLGDGGLMVGAGVEGMCALVTGAGGPSSDELGARAEFRRTYSAKDAPPCLGEPEPPPPDPTGLPPGPRRVMRAMGLA